MNSSRRSRLAATAATLGALASLAAVNPATAAASPTSVSGNAYVSSNSGGANLRACSSTTCGSYKYLGNGAGLTLICWEDSQMVYPPESNYTSNRWFKVEPYYDRSVGYVHSSLVAGQYGVRGC